MIHLDYQQTQISNYSEIMTEIKNKDNTHYHWEKVIKKEYEMP